MFCFTLNLAWACLGVNAGKVYLIVERVNTDVYQRTPDPLHLHTQAASVPDNWSTFWCPLASADIKKICRTVIQPTSYIRFGATYTYCSFLHRDTPWGRWGQATSGHRLLFATVRRSDNVSLSNNQCSWYNKEQWVLKGLWQSCTHTQFLLMNTQHVPGKRCTYDIEDALKYICNSSPWP